MNTLAIILARAGSKGLPGKNASTLAGRAILAWTIDHTRAANFLTHTCVSTDDPTVAATARHMALPVIERPANLASDTATVDAAARHALDTFQKQHPHQTIHAVVILYANVPVRPPNLIDHAIQTLRDTRCDSVQSLCPVEKNHPFWMRTLDQQQRITRYQPNNIYRRQDLPPAFQLDGGIIATTTDSLAKTDPDNPHAFLGSDQRAILTEPGQVIDIDSADDLQHAHHAILANHPTPKLTIANTNLGPGHPPYIIAELGVNHDGNPTRAVELTHAAATAGANAIKLQLFDPDLLLSDDAPLADYQKPAAHSPHQLLKKLQLTPDQMIPVRDAAHQHNLAFILTCFSPQLVPALRQLNPDAIKIASPDCVNIPLLRALLPLEKPLLISTGAALPHELSIPANIIYPRPAAFLQCVSAYPTPDQYAALAAIKHMPPLFVRGYSDHTTATDTGALALAAGAHIIEKHFTHDPTAAGPDHAASLDLLQLAQYIHAIRRAHAMLGPDQKTLLPLEHDVRAVSRQSIATSTNLPAGHTLTPDDLTTKRPGTAIPAADLDKLIGKTLAQPLPAGTLVTHEHLN